jgi:hypothetical protein
MKILKTIIVLAIFISCGPEQKSTTSESNVKKIVVAEVLHASSYTYLLSNNNGQMQWFATLKLPAAVGDTYYYEEGLEMIDFLSKELDMTFASVIFLEGVHTSEAALLSGIGKSGSPQITNSASSGLDTNVESPEGGVTIAQLMANKANYANKKVRLRGKVVKYNAGIMGKNWIHVQDGTSNGEENDITITTDMTTKVGDIITVEGVITLDKDFGAGYFYKIIVEDGKLTDVTI